MRADAEGLPSAFMTVTAPAAGRLDPATTPNFDTLVLFTTTDAALFTNAGGAGDITIDVAQGGKYAYSVSCIVLASAAILNNGPFPGERAFLFGLDTGFFDSQWLNYYFSDADRQMRTTGAYDMRLHVTGTQDIQAGFTAFPFLIAMPVLAANIAGAVTCYVQLTRLGDATP